MWYNTRQYCEAIQAAIRQTQARLCSEGDDFYISLRKEYDEWKPSLLWRLLHGKRRSSELTDQEILEWDNKHDAYNANGNQVLYIIRMARLENTVAKLQKLLESVEDVNGMTFVHNEYKWIIDQHTTEKDPYR